MNAMNVVCCLRHRRSVKIMQRRMKVILKHYISKSETLVEFGI